MFVAYRIEPVVEYEGSDESRETERFSTEREAWIYVHKLLDVGFEGCGMPDLQDAMDDLEIKLYWTLYGVHPEENGVSTDEAIADRESLTDAADLLCNLIGPFQGSSDGLYRPIFPAVIPKSDAVETIHDIADKVLADMVRQGCYTRNARFDAGTHLIMLAVPYDQSEADGLSEAFEAFRELLTSDDWEERNFQVLTVENGQPKVIETALENLSVGCSDCDTPVTRDDPYFATPCGTFCEPCMREKHAPGCGICASEFDLKTEDDDE